MEEVDNVLLCGIWSGSPTKRVELALKLKGIPYEYIEEDLSNKSELLLHYNPIHKKVPILVHNGKPVVESLVILEYIDDHWKSFPRLLPEDSYERSKVRFWANFYDQKFSAKTVILSKGEEQAKALEELKVNLLVLEEGIRRDFPGKKPFFGGDNLGFLDIAMGSSVCNYRAIEEATGIRVMDPEMHPLYYSWVTAVQDHPVVKETLPPHDKLVERICHYRKRHLQLPSS